MVRKTPSCFNATFIEPRKVMKLFSSTWEIAMNTSLFALLVLLVMEIIRGKSTGMEKEEPWADDYYEEL